MSDTARENINHHTSYHSAEPTWVYFLVYLVLVGLTVLTVGIAYVDVHPFNAGVALAIAAFKATLVAVFFMHLRRGSILAQLAAVMACGFLLLLIGLTLADFASR